MSGIPEMITTVLDGYNASILAYGCTGTGKTYTINGGYDEDIFDEEMSKGIVPRAIEDVFLQVKKRKKASPG